ncbi:hypothetical protein F5Y09DRAFT_143389 [Xylaria sp. FL1042]|nr:hypothetical protein F5Y09DRAFT_143389 [Xylaria sp. FL1042]
MQPSIEAIVAIIALLVALPPTLIILVRFYRRCRLHHITRKDSLDELDLKPTSQGPFTSSSQPSLHDSLWHTSSVRIVLEASQQEISYQNYSRSAV